MKQGDLNCYESQRFGAYAWNEGAFPEQTSRHSELVVAVQYHLNRILSDLRPSQTHTDGHIQPDYPDISEAIFAILTRREFSYLSKSRAQQYRHDISSHLRGNVAAGEPLRFYYDVGGGYHATIRPGRLEPVYQPGLGELLILRQIKRFDDEIRRIYPPGTRFSLVIDNLCALLVNDIPLALTSRYCAKLRQLIRNLELDELVDVLVEAECFTPSTYQTNTDDIDLAEPSTADIENVSRFLGRQCCPDEAKHRMARYRVVTQESERHLGTVIDGVHMTQRATTETFGFRPFPGGDSRIQTGEVVLTQGKRGQIIPQLLTSRAYESTRLEIINLPQLLPAPLTHVTYAHTL